MQVDILTKYVLPLALFLIMFGIGLSLRMADFRAVLRTPRALTVGLVAQLLLLPAIAFALAVLMYLPPEIAVGLMIIALAPGGATSNVFSYLARGDVSLSISLTAIVSLITPFTLPLATAWSMLYFVGDNTMITLPVIKTIVQLLLITVIPVALGMFVLAMWPRAAALLETGLRWLSVAFLLVVVSLIVYRNSEYMAEFFARAGLATLVLNLLTLVLGYQLARRLRLGRPQAVTISFEVGIQNGTMALVVAGTLIGDQTMMIPAVTYSLIMLASGAVFGWWASRRPAPATA